MKFIDGSNVPEDYFEMVNNMINWACDTDPGEAGEDEFWRALEKEEDEE